jgi:flagellar hook-associated protein 2
MPVITFGGLSSGLDTDSIVTALVDARKAQLITPLENRITDITNKQTALSVFQAQMANLQSASSALNAASITGRGAVSADTDTLSIGSVEETAVTGSYDVTVSALATTDKVYFAGEADSDTTTFGTGTITITSDGVSKSVVIDATNNTLAGIAEAINDTSGMSVTASIVNDGGASPYRLVLTSNATGNAADVTQDLDTVLVGLAVDAGLTAANDSQDASIIVNGLTVTKSSNTFTDAIPGVTFTIKDDTAAPTVKVTVDDDYSAATSAINTFVSYYNSLAASYDDQFTFDESTQTLGVLGSDYGLMSTQSRIKSIVFGVYNNLGNVAYESLSDIGISVDENGQMSVDSSKLSDALANDAAEVKMLFQGTSSGLSTENGLMENLYDYLESQVNSIDGILVQKSGIYTDTIDDLNDLIDARQDRIDAYEENLKARFANLETVLADLKTMETTIENFSDQMKALANKN